MKTITVAAAIILNPQHELLLVRKKHSQFFMQVGGKLAPNEAPEVTILREIQEEIGCAAEIEQFVGRFETLAANEPDHRLVSYVYVITLLDQPKIDAEIAAMQWVSLDDQETKLAPLTREVVMPWVKQNLLAAVV